MIRKRIVNQHGEICVDGSRYYVGESMRRETITVKDGKLYTSKNKQIKSVVFLGVNGSKMEAL